MKTRSLLITIAVVAASLFLAMGLYAASAPEVITMNSAGYAKHSKGLVEFTHAKHAADHKLACGECQHDDAGKPLTLKDGDPVKECGECHKEFGKLSKADRKLSKSEKIKKYQKEAMHANCVGCHKKMKKGPKKCSDCHPRKKK